MARGIGRVKLPAGIELPKWVTAEQHRRLNDELKWNPSLDVKTRLIEFALEQSGKLKPA